MTLDDTLACYTLEKGGCYVHYSTVVRNPELFNLSVDDSKLSSEGLDKMEMIVKGGLISVVHKHFSIHPDMTSLPPLMNNFVHINILRIGEKSCHTSRTWRHF